MGWWRVLKPILLLPGNALVVIPAVILWAAHGTSYGAAPRTLDDPVWWLAVVLGLAALGIMAWTMTLFLTRGEGTPAPWDPPRKLVVEGPYRHVRNPMLTGVMLFLAAETLATDSTALLGWTAFFILANVIYMPAIEEPGLLRRHGEDYRRYKAGVPRWIPCITPWRDGGGN
jgi:protein-S-isoprenylcysteine O-methyltransferase Ste14